MHMYTISIYIYMEKASVHSCILLPFAHIQEEHGPIEVSLHITSLIVSNIIVGQPYETIKGLHRPHVYYLYQYQMPE